MSYSLKTLDGVLNEAFALTFVWRPVDYRGKNFDDALRKTLTLAFIQRLIDCALSV